MTMPILRTTMLGRQALLGRHLAAFISYVNNIENLDFRILLRVTQNKFASPFYYQILAQQRFG